MKINFKLGAIFLVVLITSTYFIYNQADVTPKSALSPAQNKLLVIGDKCLDFGERAIANDQAIVAFQMVVRLSKKADVIERCMADNGYQANPAWLKYAEPLAKTSAVKTKNSIDEALATMRRADMQVFNPSETRPSYWLKNN